MERKNIAATITTILCALTFIIIGSCFSAFVYKKELIRVENPLFVLGEGVGVYDEKGEKNINKLSLSKMKLGLKPATGEEDSVTNIPTTVTDKQGTEGQYGKFKLYAPNGATISLTNIKIESDQSGEDVKKERKNIMVSIKEIDNSTSSLEEDTVVLGSTQANEDRCLLTFFIWLSGKTSDKLEAATISFDISINELET